MQLIQIIMLPMNHNFRYIVLQRDQGYLWEQISQNLDCKVTSLSNHYRRSLEKFAPLIREYLQE